MNIKNKSILIIDDELADQLAYKRYLKKSFDDTININTCETGKAALSYLKNNSADCILLDYQLPDLSGTDFLEILSDTSHKKTPTIMLTGQGNEKVAVQALKLGAYDYLIKGDLTPDVLKKTILNALEKSTLKERIQHQESEIKFMAYHDPLTGAPNRRQFEHFAEQALSRAKRHNKSMALLMLDLDRFKNVNDSLGHDSGDALLQAVIKRFQHVLRENDTLARIGGDEFALVVDQIEKPEDASVIAQKLLESLQDQIHLKTCAITTTVSIGIATYPYAGETVSQLLKHADAALYKAKEDGKNRFHFYTEKLNIQANQRLYIENGIREGLKNDEFELYYQPIYDLDSDSLYGAEALLRWHKPGHGDISPSEVIPIAEDSGLIVPLGDWVVNTALQQYKRWQDQFQLDFKLAINLSPKQINTPEWAKYAEQLVKQNTKKSDSIIFELTETDMITDMEKTRIALKYLAGVGCQIFIDDFGTGFSSLNLIRKLPVTGLKIDQSFMRDIISNKESANLVKSIISLAENMSLTIVAEGIEELEQLDFIKAHQKQKAQGFYLAKPLPANELEKIIAQACNVKTKCKEKKPLS